MDLGDLFVGLLDAPLPSGGGGREKSPAELACLLFLPLLELLLALFLGLASHPLLALAVVPLAFAVLAYRVTVRTGNGTAAGLWTAIGTFGACFFVGGVSVLLLGVASFFRMF